ncbi:MAG: helix-turn-helix domain-containing protein [Candidatus Thermoplasmatota archaeon]
MIEIKKGTLEEQIIKTLQKKYPITVSDLLDYVKVSKDRVMRLLKKFQTQGIIRLEKLPDKIYVRLLRFDFQFIGKKRQQKFIKHHKGKYSYKSEDEQDNIMYQ